jgi:hypothetical protein
MCCATVSRSAGLAALFGERRFAVFDMGEGHIQDRFGLEDPAERAVPAQLLDLGGTSLHGGQHGCLPYVSVQSRWRYDRGYPNGLLIGDRIADKLPVKAIRITAAVVFTALGVLTVAGVDRSDALYPVTAVRPTVATAQAERGQRISRDRVLKGAQAPARALGIELQPVQVNDPNDFASAFEAARSTGGQSLRTHFYCGMISILSPGKHVISLSFTGFKGASTLNS